MEKEWIKGKDGHNLKFIREDLLNYGVGRWRLNSKNSVDSIMELIRRFPPKDYEDWKITYFRYAFQNKKNGIKIDQDYLEKLGKKLYLKLKKDIQEELNSICEDECIDYIYNLVINRTYEGYQTENEIHVQLQKEIGFPIIPAPGEWDSGFSVDFYIDINGKYIGLQIKPISGRPPKSYQIDQTHEDNHKRFYEKFGGKVFFIDRRILI